jgi:hypothetical protein
MVPFGFTIPRVVEELQNDGFTRGSEIIRKVSHQRTFPTTGLAFNKKKSRIGGP